MANTLDETILTIPTENLESEHTFTSLILPDVTQVIEDRCHDYPNYFLPFNGLFIEWIYVIDLDDEVFTVNNAADFRLDKIPAAWPKKLRSATVDLPSLNLGQKIDEYALLRCEIVEPKAVPHAVRLKHLAPHIPALVYLRLAENYGSSLISGSPVWKPSDFVFKELCFALLCLASSHPDTLLMESDLKFRGHIPQGFLGLVKDGQGEQDIELVSNLLGGFHTPDTSPGSAPPDESYIFQGVLVVLVRDLSVAPSVKAAVLRAVQVGRERDLTSFHAVVMSLEHLILLQRFTDGHVEHTNSLPTQEISLKASRTRERHALFRADSEDSEIEDPGDEESEDEETGGEDREGEDSTIDVWERHDYEQSLVEDPNCEYGYSEEAILKTFFGLWNLLEAAKMIQ